MSGYSAIEQIRQPITLPCGLVLPNRTVKCPMQETCAKAPYYDPPMHLFDNLYRRWAKAEFGMVITGQVQIDQRFLSIKGDVVIHSETLDPGHIEAWEAWARLAQSEGTPCIVQLAHPGRMSPAGAGNRPGDLEPMSASAVPVELGATWMDKMAIQALLGTPREMSIEEIDTLVSDFVHAAKVAKIAGFKGVQLHGAHGFLLCQFLSPHTNRRNDAYGGTPEKRLKLMTRVIAEIRAVCPAPFCVGVKLNTGDYMDNKGLTEEEAYQQVRFFMTCGMIDFVELSGGSGESTKGKNKFFDSFGQKSIEKAPQKSSTRIREAFFTDFAERLKDIDSNVPIQLSGGFRSRLGMADALESGACQLIGIGRPVVLEPEFPKATLFNPEIPDDQAFAVPFVPRGLWVAKLSPVKIVGAGLRGKLYYYNMRRLAHGLDPDRLASIPFIIFNGVVELLKETFSGVGQYFFGERAKTL
ncbi:hypothetical protein P7C70_g1462, partial [Phenoliferia sp. Uapishka_3]